MKSIAQRIVDAMFTSVPEIDSRFEFQSYTPEEKQQLEHDCRKIEERYRELKRTTGFTESARQSRLEFVQALVGGTIPVEAFDAAMRGYDEMLVERNNISDLLHHAYIHSAYKDCGFMQMDTPQRKLFVSLLRRWDMPEIAERLKEFIAE